MLACHVLIIINSTVNAMGESSDPLLLSKKAQKLIKGSEGVPGTLLITKTKIKWHADDPNSSQPIAIQISSITRTHSHIYILPVYMNRKPIHKLSGAK